MQWLEIYNAIFPCSVFMQNCMLDPAMCISPGPSSSSSFPWTVTENIPCMLFFYWGGAKKTNQKINKQCILRPNVSFSQQLGGGESNMYLKFRKR